MKSLIPYSKPSITDLEIKYATDAAANGWGEYCYEYINRFEELFKKYLGVKYAIATSSCTGALHMGMAALGIGQADEVILADTNWIATASPIIYLGAKPVFVDILPDSWCIDPDKVEAAISPNTKAIIAVHLYGNLCVMNRLLAIGDKYGIPIIEDAAEAIGSNYYGKHAGSMGKFGAFSFHGTKTITTGEGGIFVTNDEQLFERVLTLSNHGRVRGQIKQFWPDMVGFKYKMSNIQAAIGCAQMERIDSLVFRKREIFHHYLHGLSGLTHITMNPEPEGIVIGAWMPTLVFSEESEITQKKIQDAFAKENVDARTFFSPLSTLSFFKSDYPNVYSQSISERAVNLPSFHDISNEEMSIVLNIVKGLKK